LAILCVRASIVRGDHARRLGLFLPVTVFVNASLQHDPGALSMIDCLQETTSRAAPDRRSTG
jgi:hypothetical protein